MMQASSDYSRFGGFNVPTPAKRIEELIVDDIWPNRDIVYVVTTATVEDTLKLLKEKNILSVPIVELNTNACVDVVDVLDIATFIAAKFANVDDVSLDSLQRLSFNGKFLAQEPIVNVLAAKVLKPVRLPLFPVTPRTSLPVLIQVFSNGIHRVPVVDESNKVVNFISQSDLLRYLADHSYLLAQSGIIKQNIAQLRIWNTTVHYCKGTALVLDALKIMAARGLSAMPLINDQNRLIGNFSISDIRGLGAYDFGELLLTIPQFLRKYNVKSLYPLSCTTTDTLEHVIMKIAATKVHRLWVVDDNETLMGVVSLTDVMKPLVGFSTPDFRLPK